MFLIDDILLFPIRGILSVFREIHKATEQDVENEGEAIRTKLSDLYMTLETGGMEEKEFERQEKELLDRLDEIEALRTTENEDEEETVDEGELEENEVAVGAHKSGNGRVAHTL